MKYYVEGKITLTVEGEIEAENQSDADLKALGLVSEFTPGGPLSATDQYDFEMGDVIEQGEKND